MDPPVATDEGFSWSCTTKRILAFCLHTFQMKHEVLAGINFPGLKELLLQFLFCSVWISRVFDIVVFLIQKWIMKLESEASTLMQAPSTYLLQVSYLPKTSTVKLPDNWDLLFAVIRYSLSVSRQTTKHSIWIIGTHCWSLLIWLPSLDFNHPWLGSVSTLIAWRAFMIVVFSDSLAPLPSSLWLSRELVWHLPQVYACFLESFCTEIILTCVILFCCQYYRRQVLLMKSCLCIVGQVSVLSLSYVYFK